MYFSYVPPLYTVHYIMDKIFTMLEMPFNIMQECPLHHTRVSGHLGYFYVAVCQSTLRTVGLLVVFLILNPHFTVSKLCLRSPYYIIN